MKKNISALGLVGKNSIYKLLALIIIMGILESLVFVFDLNRSSAGGAHSILDYLPAWKYIMGIFAVGFALLMFILSKFGGDYGAKESYTLKRLKISEKEFFLVQAFCNTMCFFILWVSQIVISVLLSVYYTSVTDPILTSGQTIMLAFYRNNFLHGLLPLYDTVLYVKNIFLVIGLGFLTSSFSYKQRRGKQEWILFIYIAICIGSFIRLDLNGVGDNYSGSQLDTLKVTLVVGAFTLYIVYSTLFNVFKKDGSLEGRETS